ncbi:hypothetical protein [Acinetobacter bereziniae]|uniref:Uncharacterized protein n=1 Tax=Acinetobacter bereziniae NIPH 3 TaxID=1217651 RepID=N8YUA4_ACIBZ|nr:hypothetical protein [Acinetobacter bereziniae]ENV23098.1 hypothetical protein F963_00882 [Acinetobacter bereziniae NIPH 3]
MNFKSIESKFKKNSVKSDLVRAYWSQVRFCPDLVSNEQIAIGIFANLDGINHVRFIEDFSRLECAYGSEIVEYTKNCIEIFEDFIHQNYELSFSKQLIIEKRGLVQGSDINQILEELLEKTVPLSHHHSSTQKSQVFKTVKTVTFKSDVKSYVKRKIGEAYKDVFNDEATLVGNEDVGFRRLNISLQDKKNNKIGDMVSSVYATPEKIEINCLKSLDNLGRAKNYLESIKDTKLFMLLPNQFNLDLMTKAEQTKRKNIISDFRWRLGCEGIKLSESDSSEELSEEVISWSNLNPNLTLV